MCRVTRILSHNKSLTLMSSHARLKYVCADRGAGIRDDGEEAGCGASAPEERRSPPAGPRPGPRSLDPLVAATHDPGACRAVSAAAHLSFQASDSVLRGMCQWLFFEMRKNRFSFANSKNCPGLQFNLTTFTARYVGPGFLLKWTTSWLSRVDFCLLSALWKAFNLRPCCSARSHRTVQRCRFNSFGLNLKPLPRTISWDIRQSARGRCVNGGTGAKGLGCGSRGSIGGREGWSSARGFQDLPWEALSALSPASSATCPPPASLLHTNHLRYNRFLPHASIFHLSDSTSLDGVHKVYILLSRITLKQTLSSKQFVTTLLPVFVHSLVFKE